MVMDTSVRDPGADATAAVPPWRSTRPMIEWRMPARSRVDRGGIEARARVAHKHVVRRAGELRVHADRLAAVPRRIGRGLARGADHRTQRVGRGRVAHVHHLDRDAVRVLDLGHGRRERRRHRVGLGPTVLIQVGAQVALLGARQAAPPSRVLRLRADERQRLQHRVVQVRGDLRALELAHALLALDRHLADEPHPPRRQHQGRGAHGGHGHQDRPQQRAVAKVPLGKPADGGDRQGHAHHHARPRVPREQAHHVGPARVGLHGAIKGAPHQDERRDEHDGGQRPRAQLVKSVSAGERPSAKVSMSRPSMARHHDAGCASRRSGRAILVEWLTRYRHTRPLALASPVRPMPHPLSRVSDQGRNQGLPS